MPSVNGSKAIIIGGTHGMGLATAQLLISQGAQVIVTGRSAEPIQSAKQQLGDQAHVIQSDTTSLPAISALAQTTIDHFGSETPLDLVFINAGYARLEPFTDVTEESYHRTCNTNILGAFFSAQKLAPLIKSGGSIIFTTSIANRRGIPGMSIYGAAKAAVHSLSQTLAAELAPRGIRVNVVSPGYIKTPTMGVVGTSREDLDEFEKQGAQVTPLGRIGAPEEVAKAVVFLGYEATFSTGSEVVVDGGLLWVEKGEH
ncbi:NAD(P)-binding protein [Zopfia rhizophila CBS 207.26]|uniref:NAD(P)-binding protein n=1 Tax=Zopfia rhizophila CBS 207.26 TaxID=1314779 RepID=A0A6A6E3V6_9PEZI|nr:NAD(P)-binding protein [Zopfia rhizophila CBS 207.26]